jgi:protoheme IX farnesyltransferase
MPFYISGSGAYVYMVTVSIFDALLLATNIKLLASPTKDNARLTFKFSSPYLAVIFLAAMVAVLV